MIYVHAKGMVVDDEYVIVGYANINRRSLAGSKDTEIAMGAYQPHQTWAVKNHHPRGQAVEFSKLVSSLRPDEPEDVIVSACQKLTTFFHQRPEQKFVFIT